jgi:hypothetical protein
VQRGAHRLVPGGEHAPRRRDEPRGRQRGRGESDAQQQSKGDV